MSAVLQAVMRIRTVVAAALALLVPVTTLAQPLQPAQPPPPADAAAPIAEPSPMPQQAPPPPVVTGQIVVPQPVVAQPFPMTGPRTLPYEEGGPVPQGYVLEERSRRGLVIAGSVILGALYLISLMTYSVAQAVCDVGSCENDLWPLTIPVVGPFLAIATTDADVESGASLLVLDGLGQGAGLAMLILGVASKKQVWVRADLAALQDLHLAPVAFARGGRGLALAGRF